MFDISLAELLTVGVVGLLVLGPKEFISLIKSLRTFASTIQEYYANFMRYLEREIGDIKDDYVDIIIDDDGNPQKVYDLEKIKPYIYESPLKPKKNSKLAKGKKHAKPKTRKKG